MIVFGKRQASSDGIFGNTHVHYTKSRRCVWNNGLYPRYCPLTHLKPLVAH